jgi:hypothetical protein
MARTHQNNVVAHISGFGLDKQLVDALQNAQQNFHIQQNDVDDQYKGVVDLQTNADLGRGLPGKRYEKLSYTIPSYRYALLSDSRLSSPNRAKILFHPFRTSLYV